MARPSSPLPMSSPAAWKTWIGPAKKNLPTFRPRSSHPTRITRSTTHWMMASRETIGPFRRGLTSAITRCDIL